MRRTLKYEVNRREAVFGLLVKHGFFIVAWRTNGVRKEAQKNVKTLLT